MDRISIVYASCSEGNGALVGMEKPFWMVDMVKSVLGGGRHESTKVQRGRGHSIFSVRLFWRSFCFACEGLSPMIFVVSQVRWCVGRSPDI